MTPTCVLDGTSTETAASTAIRKLEDFFTSLNAEEQVVMSEMVHASLIQAATTQSPLPDYARGLNGRNAPKLVESVSVPGTVMPYSHTNCGSFTVRDTEHVLPG